MATVSEFRTGVTGSVSTRNVPYVVSGALHDSDAMVAAKAQIPVNRFGKVRREISLEELGGGYYIATGHFIDGGIKGSASYEFNYQAPAVHIMQSLFTIGKHGRPAATKPPADFGGAINVVKRAEGQEVEGVDLPSPTPTNVFTFEKEGILINEAFEIAIENLLGSVNYSPFLNRPAYTMRLVSCDGGTSAGDGFMRLRFGFQYSANRTAVKIGDITIPFVGGHHLLWAYYMDDYDGVAKSLIKYPTYAYVERVFPEVNFDAIGIFR